MTADNWEPSEEIAGHAKVAWTNCSTEGEGYASVSQLLDRVLKAVRDSIIAEARPQIEAEERERVLEEAAKRVWMFSSDGKYTGPKEAELCNHLAAQIRALKDSKPSPLAPRYPAISITEEDLKDAST